MAKLVSRSTAAVVALCTAGWGCTVSENALYECKVEERLLEGDAQVAPALGFAPAAVMSWASGSHTADARWSAPATGTHANVSGETGLTLEIRA